MRGAKMPAFEGGTPIRRPRAVPREGSASAALWIPSAIMKTFNLRRGRAAQQGFTLLELLVVLLIIALLAGYVGPKLFPRSTALQGARHQAQMKTLGDALVQYRLDVGSYPRPTRDCRRWSRRLRASRMVRPVPGEGRARRCVGGPIS